MLSLFKIFTKSIFLNWKIKGNVIQIVERRTIVNNRKELITSKIDKKLFRITVLIRYEIIMIIKISLISSRIKLASVAPNK